MRNRKVMLFSSCALALAKAAWADVGEVPRDSSANSSASTIGNGPYDLTFHNGSGPVGQPSDTVSIGNGIAYSTATNTNTSRNSGYLSGQVGQRRGDLPSGSGDGSTIRNPSDLNVPGSDTLDPRLPSDAARRATNSNNSLISPDSTGAGINGSGLNPGTVSGPASRPSQGGTGSSAGSGTASSGNSTGGMGAP